MVQWGTGNVGVYAGSVHTRGNYAPGIVALSSGGGVTVTSAGGGRRDVVSHRAPPH